MQKLEAREANIAAAHRALAMVRLSFLRTPRAVIGPAKGCVHCRASDGERASLLLS